MQIKTFFSNIQNENQKIEDFSLPTKEFSTYIDLNIPIEQKIEFEKRRRYQTYMTLDYYLSLGTYYDFFSIDSLKILIKARESTVDYYQTLTTTDFLILPFFEVNLEIKNLLEKHGITTEVMKKTLDYFYKINPDTFLQKKIKSIRTFLTNLDTPLISENAILKNWIFPNELSFSEETSKIFKKASENALLRFKTPVITTEILLITILEEKNLKIGRFLKLCLVTDTNWYMLRYSLMKRLHHQELATRKEIPKNYQYFAYLLKTELPEVEFDTLINNECLLPGILLFRNKIIADVLQVDISTLLKQDIFYSIKSRKKRKYSKK